MNSIILFMLNNIDHTNQYTVNLQNTHVRVLKKTNPGRIQIKDYFLGE